MTELVKGLVTIAIPAYKASHSIARVLSEALAQSYVNTEILISDNASPGRHGDKIRNIVEKFSKEDKRIHFFRQEKNLGVVGNFNFLLQKAKGEYFIWLAVDDGWLPEYLQKCVELFANNNDVVLCSSDPLLKKYQNTDDYIYSSDLVTTGLSKAQALKKVIGYKGRYTELYGLLKTRVAQSYKWKNIFGEDVIFLMYMAMQGRIEKTQPGLFISAWRNFSSSSLVKTVQVYQLDKSKIYFGYLYLMRCQINFIWHQQDSLSFIERLTASALVIKKYLKSPYRNAIVQYAKYYWFGMKKQYPEIPLETLHRYRAYYPVLNTLLKKHIQGLSSIDYLHKKGYVKLAIYGAGELAQRLCEIWQQQGVSPVCIVDENLSSRMSSLNGIQVLSLSDFCLLQNIDLIIITPVYDYDEIELKLIDCDVECEIMSLAALINDF